MFPAMRGLRRTLTCSLHNQRFSFPGIESYKAFALILLGEALAGICNKLPGDYWPF